MLLNEMIAEVKRAKHQTLKLLNEFKLFVERLPRSANLFLVDFNFPV